MATIGLSSVVAPERAEETQIREREYAPVGCDEQIAVSVSHHAVDRSGEGRSRQYLRYRSTERRITKREHAAICSHEPVAIVVRCRRDSDHRIVEDNTG